MPRLRFKDGALVYGVRRVRADLDSTTYHLDDPIDDAPNVVAPSSDPTALTCRCGCKRPGTSRDYRGFASYSCLARGEER